MFRKYWALTEKGFREASEYRLSAITSFLNAWIFIGLYWAVWSAIASSGQLSSSLNEIISYIAVAQVVRQVFNMGPEGWFGDRIRRGTITNELKRPISIRAQNYFHELGWAIFRTITRGIPVLLVGIVFLNVQIPSAINLFGFIVSTFLSLNLVISFAYIFAMLVFWTKIDWSLRMTRVTLQDLFSGIMFPLFLLPESLKQVFFALPFHSMVDTPVSIFLGQKTGLAIIEAMGIQVIWTIIFLIIGTLLWIKAKKKLTVQGG